MRGLDGRAHHLYRAAATGRTDVIGTAGMGLLQRTVGNGALGPVIQRARNCSTEQAEEERRPPVHEVVSSGGSPLDTETRTDLGSRMGAHAYTVGNNVVFQRDAYDPSSPQGRTALTHELTHVIQQRQGPVLVFSGTSARKDGFLTQARPARGAVQLTLHEGELTTRSIRLRGRAGEQTFDLRGSDTVRAGLAVDSAYGTGRDRRIALAEVEFFGHRPAGPHKNAGPPGWRLRPPRRAPVSTGVPLQIMMQPFCTKTVKKSRVLTARMLYTFEVSFPRLSIFNRWEATSYRKDYRICMSERTTV
ncbi:DUF4157 domain-containing protein [Streptomyces sp. NPDC051217]|uniref:DUF4157 domain-containing protein n=1 Tax=Streptomyces sp. NPDC051217 TaxID=3365644 RepID=UPI0037B17B41